MKTITINLWLKRTGFYLLFFMLSVNAALSCGDEISNAIESPQLVAEQETVKTDQFTEVSQEQISSTVTEATQENQHLVNESAVNQAPVNQTSVNQISAKAPVQIGSGAHIASVTLALCFIVALIFVASWVIRRMSTGVFSQTGQMNLVASMALGTRERVVLVEIGGKQILLGVTAQQINSLHVFDEPVVANKKSSNSSDFSQKLMAILQQKPIADVGSKSHDSSSKQGG